MAVQRIRERLHAWIMSLAGNDPRASQPHQLLANVLDVLRGIDPLCRPRPFEVEAALEEKIGSVARSDQPQLTIDLAEWIFDRCASCDVTYTYNVLQLVDRGRRAMADAPGSTPILVRSRLIAARAYAFHLVGTKAENLARAVDEVGEASRIGAAAVDPRRWAATLLDVARAGELAGDQGSPVEVQRLYDQILDTTAAGAARYREIAAARSANTHPPASIGSLMDATVDTLQSALEPYASDDILPGAMAPAATRLGTMYLTRAEPGDGHLARRWLQAAERSFYYNPSGRPHDYARNQIMLARYFSVVSVNDPEDADYVANKALIYLNGGFQLAAEDVDLHAECFLVAAQLWAQRDHGRATEFLATALSLEGLTPAVRGKVELEQAHSLGSSPSEALPAIDRAVELLGAGPRTDDDLLAAMLLKARLLVAEDQLAHPRDHRRPVPTEATSLMREVALRRTERGDLPRAYSAYRTIAQWSVAREEFVAALQHYEDCRRVAKLMIQRDARAFLDEQGSSGVDDERRAALIDNPTPALLRAHRVQEIAIQMASVDHQVAAYCAARSGRFEEALHWMLGSRLRNMTAAGRIQLDASSSPQPGAEQIIVVPIVGDADTIVLLYREGHQVEALTLPLRHAQLRRMVFADEDDLGYDRGWVTLYREFERDTPFLSVAFAEFAAEPNELWWHSLRDDIVRYGRYFAEPLMAALTERRISARRLLLVPSGLLSFMPLHAVQLGDDTWAADHYAVQLAFGPTLPLPQDSTAVTDDPTAVVVRGENDLVYSGLETRAVASLLAAKSVKVTQARSKADVLAAIERAEYLHIASHGVFDSARWVNSRIELSGGEAITLREVLARDLSQVRLAILSACETGVSHLTGLQEEFYGFPAVFAAAGVHAVVSTLWRVDDLASALLLEAFYLRYVDGMNATAALNDARLWLRDLTAETLVERARAELATPKAERKWRPVECSGVIGRFASVPSRARPFQSPYHWAAFTIWQTD